MLCCLLHQLVKSDISFGLTSCAEMTAIVKMISEKGLKKKIKLVAVTITANVPCSPCGSCRQVI